MQKLRTTRTASTLAMAAVLLVGSHVHAATSNPFVTPSGWAGLLQDPAVQRDLKLSKDQIADFKKLIGKLPESPTELEAEIRKHVMGEQLTRIEQLNWQREGGYALFDPKVAKALSLTDEQQKRLADAAKVNAAEHEKMREFMARARFRSQEAMEQFVEGYRNPANERLLNVLSKDQQVAFKSLLGKPLLSKSKE